MQVTISQFKTRNQDADLYHLWRLMTEVRSMYNAQAQFVGHCGPEVYAEAREILARIGQFSRFVNFVEQAFTGWRLERAEAIMWNMFHALHAQDFDRYQRNGALLALLNEDRRESEQPK